MFSEKIMKAIIALWNAAFGLSGAILCFVGAHILVQLGKYWEFIDGNHSNLPGVFGFVGFVVIAAAIFGGFISLFEKHLMVRTLLGLVAGIVLFESGLLLATHLIRNNSPDNISAIMKEDMRIYQGVSKETWSLIQTDFSCCGFENFRDWSNVTFGVSGNVPDSCCVKPTSGCGRGFLNESNPFALKKINIEGCYEGVEKFFTGNLDSVFRVLTGHIVFHFLFVIVVLVWNFAVLSGIIR